MGTFRKHTVYRARWERVGISLSPNTAFTKQNVCFNHGDQSNCPHKVKNVRFSSFCPHITSTYLNGDIHSKKCWIVLTQF